VNGRGADGEAVRDYVFVTGSRGPVQQRNAQRALATAKQAAGLDALEGRLSWHSLRHAAGSVWLTEYGLAVTTVSAMMGHANPSFTLACSGRDPRDTETMVADVLARAAATGS
jgi:site-specific recombinase XerD